MTDARLFEYNPTAPAGSIILLHGLGASGDDLFPLADHLADGKMRVVCPHAPVRSVTLNGGFAMRAWYDIIGVNLQDRQDVAGIADSAADIEALIAAEKERGVAPQQIFLAGFSQGAAMSLHVGLRHADTLGGIIALSGYLLFADSIHSDTTTAGRQTPIFQAHGQYDPVVMLQWGRDTRDILQAAGCALAYYEYPMAHAILPEEIKDINHWLATTVTEETP